MELLQRKRLTIITELALEASVTKRVKALGGTSLTISDCKTQSADGLREGDWDQNRNISLHVICEEALAESIMVAVEQAYCDDYFVVMYTSDITVHASSNL